MEINIKDVGGNMYNSKYQEALDRIEETYYNLDNCVSAMKRFGKDVQTLSELVDKEATKFINECNCIFDSKILDEAIDLECKNRNIYKQNEYKIYLSNDYPCISLAHDKIRIHFLIGKLLYGNIRKGYVIHHKDFNKLNALPENLEYLSCSAHTKIHHNGVDFRSEEGKLKGINAAKEKRYKKQIKKEDIEKMLAEGKTKYEIARYYNCGVNTIYRRLGYKF